MIRLGAKGEPMTKTKTLPLGGREASRREFLRATGWAIGAGGVLPIAWASGQQADQADGPAVWLGMNQAELDAAYDQSAYASNREKIVEQEALSNRAVVARLGAPQQFTYGPGNGETLDVYRADRDAAPIHVHFHGGTWRFGAASQFAYMAEPFVRSGAAMVIPDFSAVDDVNGGLTVS